MTTTKAFVAGATGLTGRFLVERLRARGIATWAHVRPDSPRRDEWRGRFEAMGATLDATPWVEDSFVTRFAGADAPTLVFACLGTTRAREKKAAREGRDAARESYAAVDVALSEMLIRASVATRARGLRAPRFVYLSSVGAGALGKGAYLDARTQVEITLRASELPYVIARPSSIVGERDEHRALERYAVPALDGALRLVGALGARRVRDRYHSIGGRELAEALTVLGLEQGTSRIVESDELARIAASHPVG